MHDTWKDNPDILFKFQGLHPFVEREATANLKLSDEDGIQNEVTRTQAIQKD